MIKPNALQLKKLKFWRNSTFAVMLIGYIGYYICRANLSAAFPLISKTFGYTNTQLGLIASASEIAYAIGKFINGPLADRIGGRFIFLIGMAGAIVFNVIFAYSSSIAMFIVVWCLCRYFLSMGWGGIAKTIGAWYEPKSNGTVMGFISLNFQFGGVVATLFAGYLVSLGCSWDKLFLYPAGVLSIIWIWSFFSSKESPQAVIPDVKFGRNNSEVTSIADIHDDEQGSGSWKIMSHLLKMKLFRQLLVFSFVTTLLRSIFFFWIPKLLVDIGMKDTNAILKSAIFPFLGCLGTILLGWYTDKYAKNGDRARAMWIMLTGLLACLLMTSFLIHTKGNLNLIVFLISMCGFFLLGPYAMSSGCLTLDIAGSKGAGSCTGLIDGVGYLGGALASWGAGALSDILGWSGVFLVLSGFSFFAVFSAYLMSQEFQAIYKRRAVKE
ncbi:MFS transporter [bacterium]|nr:MFS transporter [bacterium]